ncbi:hypothetical protein GQ457_01G043750 [Hibiscus cannabinus]
MELWIDISIIPYSCVEMHGLMQACFEIRTLQGLVLLSVSLFLLKPRGCGDEQTPCGSHSTFHIIFFYLSVYLVALGNGGYQPNIATFGADQFDEEGVQK